MLLNFYNGVTSDKPFVSWKYYKLKILFFARAHTCFIGWNFDRFACGGCPLQQESVQGLQHVNPHSEEEEGRGLLRERGTGEAAGACRRYPSVAQCGRFLGPGAPKGSSGLGSFWPGTYVLLAVAGSSFVEYAKQVGSTWLKICLFGLCLKQLNVQKLEVGASGLYELMSFSRQWKNNLRAIFGSFI